MECLPAQMPESKVNDLAAYSDDKSRNGLPQMPINIVTSTRRHPFPQNQLTTSTADRSNHAIGLENKSRVTFGNHATG